MSTEHWKASIYSRVSTDRQKDDESIEQQQEQNRRSAKENGYEIVDEFSDESANDTTQ